MHDVRDVRGRLVRLAIATVIGVIVSVAISILIPTHRHFFFGCMHSEGWLVPGGDPVLMLAGAVVSALAVYDVLCWRARRAWLPRARLLSRRV